MDIPTDTLLYITLFLSVLLLVEGVYMLGRDLRGQSEKLNRRLRLISGLGDGREVLATLRRERQDPMSIALGRVLPWLEATVARAGLVMPLVRIIALMFALGGITFVFLRIVLPTPIGIAGLSALLVGAGVPYLLLVRMANSRAAAFGRQLPDALDLIVRSLRAGHPVNAALELVAREMPDPVGTNFGILIDEMTYGMSLPEALESMARRMPHPDLRYLVVTIQIQYQSGGNLAEVLSNLSRVIRDRFAMYAKIRAVSSEGRLSGILVGLLPPIVAGLISILNPAFFGDVKDDPLFLPLIGLAVILLLLGQFTIWRMVRMKV